MPVIIKNGKTYGDRSVTLSKAEYDALSSAEKLNGTVYYIYDSNENMGINVELTQAQYDALVDPDPDTVYYITDGTVSYPTAEDMRYQEGVSVADALDTLNAGLITQEVTEIISTGNKLYAIKTGDIVTLQTKGNGIAISTSGIQIPTAFAPESLVQIMVPCYTSDWTYCRATIDPSGVITIYGGSSKISANYVCLNVTYALGFQ